MEKEDEICISELCSVDNNSQVVDNRELDRTDLRNQVVQKGSDFSL